jgi:hypothetical protein
MCSGDCRDTDTSPDPVVLVSATLYLMSCHAMNPCPRLADMVTRHLCALSRMAHMPPTLKATCRELCGKWERLSLGPCKPGLLSSYVAGPQTAQ